MHKLHAILDIYSNLPTIKLMMTNIVKVMLKVMLFTT